MPIRRMIPCTILMLLMLLPPAPAFACLPLRLMARDMFHTAYGVYLARLDSGHLYKVIDTLRGSEASLVRVPGVLEELNGCSVQPVPQEDEEYLIVTYCEPAAEEPDAEPDAPGVLHFSCRANAWPAAEYQDYVEFLERDELVSRSDLIERLSAWDSGKISLADAAAWLEDKHRHADVMDWTDDEASLTGDLLLGLSTLFEDFADCSGQTVRAQKAFKTRILPSVITLLRSGWTGPEDPAAEDLVDEIFDLSNKAEDLAGRRGCYAPAK